jgi:hypothetical protein
VSSHCIAATLRWHFLEIDRAPLLERRPPTDVELVIHVVGIFEFFPRNGFGNGFGNLAVVTEHVENRFRNYWPGNAGVMLPCAFVSLATSVTGQLVWPWYCPLFLFVMSNVIVLPDRAYPDRPKCDVTVAGQKSDSRFPGKTLSFFTTWLLQFEFLHPSPWGAFGKLNLDAQ